MARMTIQEKMAEREAQLKRAEELKARREKEKKEKEERIKELKEKMKDPVYRAERKVLMAKLKEERPLIRKELRGKGMRSYADYSFFCKELNMGYPEDTRENSVDEFLARLSAWFAYFRNRVNVWIAMLVVVLILLLLFLFAFISEEKGRFTVNITAEMLREGFVLSETEDMNKTKTRLYATEITNSNATSIYEINRGLADADGSHNGPGYMAYTFYLKNEGTMTVDYGYTVNILSETIHAGDSAWVMFFEDDKQIIYAREQENGEPENLWGYPNPPFSSSAYYPDEQYYKADYAYGIITTPFIDEYTALQGYVENFAPGDVKKYTMIVWIEGDDPDCNNSQLGGHVGFNIQFDRLGEEKSSYFKGLFREEYEKSYWYGNDDVKIPEVTLGAEEKEQQQKAREEEPETVEYPTNPLEEERKKDHDY